MTKPYDMHPTTDTEVFEMLHGLFGIGDYNADDAKPWHKFRMVEVSKIKAIRTKRRWTFGDFAEVARYCSRQNIAIKRTFDLLAHHGAAMLEVSRNARQRREDVFQEAVDLELAAGLPDSLEWAERLQLAAGRHREELLEEWRQTRERTLREAIK